MSTRDTWVDFMKTRMFPWRRKNIATGEWETKMVCGALRPIEIWEYVFPEECLAEVLGMQHTNDGGNSVLGAVKLRPEIKNYVLLMQKLLNLKQIPEIKNPTLYGYKDIINGIPLPVNWVPTDGFAVYPIGIKEDVKQEYPHFIEAGAPKGYYQEGL